MYPIDYTTDATLKEVTNDATNILEKNFDPKSETTITVSDSSVFNATGGYVTIYSFHNSIDDQLKASTFSYDSVEGNAIKGVKLIYGSDIVRPSGCKVTSNIMAQQFNTVCQKLFDVEDALGCVNSQNTSSVKWFIEKELPKLKSPKSWFVIDSESERFTTKDTVYFTNKSVNYQFDNDTVFEWSFGDGVYSYDFNTSHVYTLPGIYSVSLLVSNKYGTDFTVIKDCVKILGEAPENAVISLSSNICIANKTSITASAYSPNNGDNPVVDFEWEIEGTQSYFNGQNVNIGYSAGGLYDLILKQKTLYGNYSKQRYHKKINIIEDMSLWMISQNENENTLNFNEYMPESKAWKDSVFTSIDGLWDDSKKYIYDGSVHEDALSSNFIAFVSTGESTIQPIEYDIRTRTLKILNGIQCQSGWETARICPTESSDNYEYVNSIYIMFGGGNSQMINVYDITSGTFKSVPASESLFRDELVKSKIASYKDAFYIMTAKNDKKYNYFSSYDVTTNSWKAISLDSAGTHIPRFDKCALASTHNGIAAFGNSGSFTCYAPETDSWIIGTSETLNNGFKSDTMENIKCMPQSKCGYGSAGTSYIYNDVSNDIYKYESALMSIGTESSIMSNYCKGGTCK